MLIKWLVPEPSRTSRPHLSPRASFLSFSSVSPLRPLGLGFLGRGSVRSPMYFYVVTDAGPASRRVRLWPGGPASTSSHFRWFSCFYAVRRYVTGTRLLQVRPLGHPELRKRPWPLWRPRGDGNGGRFVRSPCLPSWRGLCLYAVHQMLALWHLFPFVPLCSNSPLSSRPQPLGRVGDDTPCEDTGEDFGLFVNFPSTTYCCRVFFYFVSPGPLWLNEGV